MGNATNAQDFIILGPMLAPGNNVLEAVHSLYYLPENYKLLFTDAAGMDSDFHNEVVALMKRDGVEERVLFAEHGTGSDAIVVPFSQKSGSVHDASSEAIASSILHATRVAA